MNTAERIAATYLRLNGFLLLPQFTVFIGGNHGHVDLVGLRANGSNERAGEFTFPTDQAFFESLGQGMHIAPLDTFLGLVGEVKTNSDHDPPKQDQIDYITPFLGGVPIAPVFFSEAGGNPAWAGNYLHVGNAYALKWVFSRASVMNEQLPQLTKGGSWALSDDALLEILVLGKLIGAIKDRPTRQ